MTFEKSEPHWNAHNQHVEGLVCRLQDSGLQHCGFHRGADPAGQDLPAHAFMVSPVYRTDPEKGIIPRDLLIRIGDGPQTVLKAYATNGAGASSLYRAIAYILVSEAPSLHLVAGFDTLPRGFLAMIPQKPLDIVEPVGIRTETTFLKHLEAFKWPTT